MINFLRIKDFRIFPDAEFSPGEGVNFLVGGNGAGKTSILETVYVLGRGRSFRQVDNLPVIRDGSRSAVIYAELAAVDGTRHRLGVEKDRSNTEIRLDGGNVKRRSELLALLPLVWVSPNSQAFLEHGPDVRRRFIDLGLFHVEPDYLGAFGKFTRVLKQRNEALRRGMAQQASSWDELFFTSSLAIDEYRQGLVSRLEKETRQVLLEWGNPLDITFSYRSGWDKKAALAAVLIDKREQELAAGYSLVGPQRADWVLRTGKTTSSKHLSRGQQKLLVAAINLAMTRLWVARGLKPVVLIDDLAAELSMGYRRAIAEGFASQGCQCFITGLETGSLPLSDQRAETLFHVEHASITSVKRPN